MMVLFQNKIIYMPGLPPTARGEKLSDYTNLVSGIEWQEARTRAADGTDLALAVASVSSPTSAAASEYSLSEPSVAGHVYILYLQGMFMEIPFDIKGGLIVLAGNANSIPPRLPDISWVLGKLRDSNDAVGVKMRYTMVCLSYRGYWTSRGRPSEVGINQDTVAAVQWIAQLHENTYSQAIIRPKPIFVLWGQSVGAGFATNLAASGTIPHTLPLEAMILETPFLSIRTMLETLYPQKWLPYRYLHPFLRNHLDSWKNLGVIASSSDERGEMLPHVFILQAARDELVPAHHASDLEKRCSELGLPVERKKAPRAFHNEALYRAKAPVVNFITRQASRVMSGVENFPHT